MDEMPFDCYMQRSLATDLQSLSMEFRKKQSTYLKQLRQQKEVRTSICSKSRYFCYLNRSNWDTWLMNHVYRGKMELIWKWTWMVLSRHLNLEMMNLRMWYAITLSLSLVLSPADLILQYCYPESLAYSN